MSNLRVRWHGSKWWNGISWHLRCFCWHIWCNFDVWVQNLEINITFMLAFYLLLTTEVECLRICKHGNNEWVSSNRILAFAHRFLGSPRDNIVTRNKGTYGERLFGRPKKAILARDYDFFAVVLSYMDKDNVVTLS